MGRRRGPHRVLVGKPERKRTLGRPRRRWEENSKINLKKSFGSEWTGLMWLGMEMREGLL
jgi:hypothetical protein